VGKAREQEIRITGLGLIALIVLASFLAVMTATMLGGTKYFHLPQISASHDVGNSAPDRAR
jgi:hypothetical protein